MDSIHKTWDLEAGRIPRSPPAHIAGHESSASTNDSDHYLTSDNEKPSTAQPPDTTPTTIWKHFPITTQRAHLLAITTESLSVGLGLGSAVGTWACIHTTLTKATATTNNNNNNPHIANWAAGLLMGFFLAPLLEKASRVLFGKAAVVLVKPSTPHFAARLTDHAITICAALLGVGICKAVQMQYGPFHSNLGFEYAVFVVGFTAYAFVRVVLYTIGTGHDYDGDRIECAWTEVPSVVFCEFLDHFFHLYVVISVNVRDFLTFALYPYLMEVWIGYWEVIDPEGKYVWLLHMLNIGFFFTFFSVLKEVTFLVARVFWSEDLPVHRHHGMQSNERKVIELDLELKDSLPTTNIRPIPHQ